MSENSQPAGREFDAGEQARADIYRLLGALLAAPPDAAMIGLLRDLQPAADTADTAMKAVWQGLRAAAANADPDRLKDEYFKLFIGLGRGELVPYASFYIHGLLMEKVLASLREELAGLGIERQADVAEPEDHAAAVCEIMGMIISEDGLHSKQSAFFEDYVAPWLGHFFADLGEAEAADFYRAVAQLGQQFLAVEQRYFSLPV
ncbi:MAG: molecular chaperone TorD family protein [Gammaproteobacteria bacterium]|nr:MAG: molecular chaperone TorD family protein [Gammaproteobacteria bacterium]